MKGPRLPRVKQELGEKTQMSLMAFAQPALRRTRSSQPSSSIQPLAEPIESPLRGNLLEGGLRINGMPSKGFSDPVTSDETGFYSNIPVSELIKHVTRAIEASDVASTPPVVEIMDGATLTKRAGP